MTLFGRTRAQRLEQKRQRARAKRKSEAVDRIDAAMKERAQESDRIFGDEIRRAGQQEE